MGQLLNCISGEIVAPHKFIKYGDFQQKSSVVLPLGKYLPRDFLRKIIFGQLTLSQFLWCIH